jgi:hypothetical protein
VFSAVSDVFSFFSSISTFLLISTVSAYFGCFRRFPLFLAVFYSSAVSVRFCAVWCDLVTKTHQNAPVLTYLLASGDFGV